MRRLAQAVVALAATFYFVGGIWAFSAPRSFYTQVATYPPYNEHLVHDLGAFQLGLAAVALAGLLFADALLAVLVGLAAGSVMHEVSHLTDRLLGGRASDPATVGAVAVVILVGLLAAARAARKAVPDRGRSR